MPIFALLRAKWFLGIIAVFFVFSNFTYIAYLRQENSRLKADLAKINEALYQCHQENLALSKELQLQHRKYQAKINKLLKLASKPPKVIKVPQVITKKVYITNEDCQRMCIMLDKFIKIQKEQK